MSAGNSRRHGETHQSNNQIPHRPDELNTRDTNHAPKHNSHVYHRLLIFRVLALLLILEAVQPRGIEDHRTKSEVAEDPGQHDGASESLVVVCLLLFFRDNGDFLGRLLGEFR